MGVSVLRRIRDLQVEYTQATYKNLPRIMSTRGYVEHDNFKSQELAILYAYADLEFRRLETHRLPNLGLVVSELESSFLAPPQMLRS
jgi:hypothetical protein